MKAKRNLLFNALLCLAVLGFFYEWVVTAHHSVLGAIGNHLLGIEVHGVACGRVCSLRIMVYLALLVATTQIGIAKRFLLLLAGLTVFLAIDVASLPLWSSAQFLQSQAVVPLYQSIYAVIWDLLGGLVLPILLWLVAVDQQAGWRFSAPDRHRTFERQNSFSQG